MSFDGYHITADLINAIPDADARARMSPLQIAKYEARRTVANVLRKLAEEAAKDGQPLIAKFYIQDAQRFSWLANRALYSVKSQIAWERNAPPKPITT